MIAVVKTKEDAKKALGDVAVEKRFYCVDSCIYNRLEDMANCLEHINEDLFRHHVTPSHNDFSNWVRDVLNDDKLAEDLSKSPNAEDSARIVRYRIHWLKRKLH